MRRGKILMAAVSIAALLGNLSLWAEDPKPREIIAAHKKAVTFVAFTPDGKSLISSGADERPDPTRPVGTMMDVSITKLWDLAGHKSVTIQEGQLLPSCVILGDAKRLIFLQPRFTTTTGIYDVAGGKVKSVLGISPDGKAQVDGDKLRQLATAFDVTSVEKTIPLTGASGPESGFDQVATFSPDGKTLVMRDKDKNLMLWDVPSGKNTATLVNSNGLWYVISPDSKTLAVPWKRKRSGSPDEILGVKLFAVASGKEIATLQPEPASLTGRPIFSPDSKTLAFGYSALEIYSAASGKRTKTLQYPGKAIGPDLVFSPDGRHLSANCRDGTLKVWNVASAKIVASLKGPSSLPAFSPDGKTLAAGYEDGKILLWDVAKVSAK